jgi:hypothetical protein
VVHGSRHEAHSTIFAAEADFESDQSRVVSPGWTLRVT